MVSDGFYRFCEFYGPGMNLFMDLRVSEKPGYYRLGFHDAMEFY